MTLKFIDMSNRIVIRVRKVAPKRLLIEQRRRFLFWHFWSKGCPLLGLSNYYANKQTAKTAINAKASKKNVKPIVIFT